MVLATVSLLVLAFICTNASLYDPEYDPNLFEGDMLMSPNQLITYKKGGINPKIPLGASKFSKWPKTIPYKIAGSLSGESQATQVIREAIRDYERLTCLRFKRRTTESDYMNFYRGSGCSSYVGFGRGRRDISLAQGCWTKGIVMHEMAHALGFFHEQSRPDRDQYVTINFHNMLQGVKGNFEKQTLRTVDSLGVPYDYDSVMHYRGTAFTRNGQKTIVTKNSRDQSRIGQRKGFSPLDIKQMNAYYQCGTVRPTGRPIVTRRPVITSRPFTNPPNNKIYVASACENQRMNLYCSRNKRIQVRTGFYGFATEAKHSIYRSKCNRRRPSYAYCSSSKNVWNVYSKCRSRSSCSIIVNERNLGYVKNFSPRYPCTGYTRYAYTYYQCV